MSCPDLICKSLCDDAVTDVGLGVQDMGSIFLLRILRSCVELRISVVIDVSRG